MKNSLVFVVFFILLLFPFCFGNDIYVSVGGNGEGTQENPFGNIQVFFFFFFFFCLSFPLLIFPFLFFFFLFSFFFFLFFFFLVRLQCR